MSRVSAKWKYSSAVSLQPAEQAACSTPLFCGNPHTIVVDILILQSKEINKLATYS